MNNLASKTPREIYNDGIDAKDDREHHQNYDRVIMQNERVGSW